ncbi:hypothetical protein [Kineococcus xinjiangensis]|nr:hypothetical protein [Kineococcus xinjiangensis]
MKWGPVSRNVALLVDPPSRQEYRVEPLTVEKARQVLAAARGERLEARWVAALTLGLRQGEALGLCWEDAADRGLAAAGAEHAPAGRH